jgi:hypothetical protein
MKKVAIFFTILLLYSAGYLLFRFSHIELWERDNNMYVIFPKESKWIYYFFRPASYFDSKVTGIGIHIGPHQ